MGFVESMTRMSLKLVNRPKVPLLERGRKRVLEPLLPGRDPVLVPLVHHVLLLILVEPRVDDIVVAFLLVLVHQNLLVVRDLFLGC